MSLKKVETIRTKIAALKSEAAGFASITPNPADVRAAVFGRLRAVAADSDRTARARLVAGEFDGLLTVRPGSNGAVDLAPILVRVLGPEVVTDALMRHVADLPVTPTAAERRQRLADIEREVFALECEEESLIEASEAAGTPIPRRADADPRAVLGMHDA